MLFLSNTFRPPLQQRRRKQSGTSVFLFGLCLGAIVPMVGLAVDLSMMYLIQTRLSSAVDAASLAAARGLSRGGDPTAQAGTAQTTANNYVEKNFPGGTYQISGSWDHSGTTTGNLWSK